jgi:hypothetical protein
MKKTAGRMENSARAAAGALLLTMLATSPVLAQSQTVPLWGLFETAITNSRSYSNPFDFNVIDLRATFTSPSGRRVDFFGFHDGDGRGGQVGNVWKLRFMPSETGTWTYVYSWSDGVAPGGAGQFTAVAGSLPGPLKVAGDNPWYFETSRGQPFHARGYDLHIWLWCGADLTDNCWKSIKTEKQNFINAIQTHAIGGGYNLIMVDGAVHRDGMEGAPESWWMGADTKRFDVATWRAWDDILRYCADRGVYALPFAGMINQGATYGFNDFKVFLHYWVARFGAFYNFFGWSPTWEWGYYSSTWTSTDVNNIMGYVQSINPFPTLLTIHDHADASLSSWMDFSMRQRQSRDIFTGNTRNLGLHGGVTGIFTNMPIIGSEDIWEIPTGNWNQPRNATEVRRGAWGILMAGVMPIYSEWQFWPTVKGNMPGEAEVKRMFDFVYGKTSYRRYRMLNSLVSSANRQICSGAPGEEYLVYDEDGGTITLNLSATPASDLFAATWFDPKTGAEQGAATVSGGASRSLTSPFSGDSVLLLKRTVVVDATPPEMLSAAVLGATQIRVTFNEALSQTSAQTITNYRISGGIAVRSAALQVDGVTVLLESSALNKDTSYTLTVSGVRDLAGNTMASPVLTPVIYSPDIEDGLVARWSFDEGTGATAFDSASTNHAAISGATWGNGVSGPAVTMDSANDYINAGTLDPSASDLTLSLWVNWRGPSGGYQVIMAKREQWAAASMRWQFYRHVDGTLRFERQGVSASFGMGIPQTNTWCHLSVTKSGSNVTLYVNGSAAATTRMSFGANAQARMLIGNSQVGGSESFNGAIDEVRVYDRALSADEVQQVFAASAAPGSTDANSNALPDSWEVAHFGSLNAVGGKPRDDFDGDGVANADEFVAGSSPVNAADFSRLLIGIRNGRTELRFDARAAAGAGYDGLERHYRVERARNPSTWLALPGYTDIVATNQPVFCPPPPQPGVTLYRVKMWLKPTR